MPHKRKSRGGFIPAGQSAGALLAALGMLALALILIIQPVQALAYFFAVPKSTVDVYVNEDGTVSLDYLYVFENQPGADSIEYVDIGMPTTSYSLDNVTASLDGQPVYNIEDSTEVSNAIALNLGSQAIPPGQTGEVRMVIHRIERMLFKASAEESEAYASFQFQPNFFGSEYVTGKTDMTITLHLPAGMQDTEPRYFIPENWPGTEAPESGFDDQDRVFYRWQSSDADVSEQYVFGASFPARLVPADVLLTEVPFQISADWICPTLICLGFAGFMGLTIWSAITGDRKRKLQYLPPKVAVEGNGIKRGLTAIEAAILMQQPMDKILTMILFSVVKKGAATVVSRDPMKLEVTTPAPEDLRSYETDFLEAMQNPQVGAQRRGLQDLMTKLVQSISEKMRGFSRNETVTYYQDIMKKAWQQVEQAQTPEMKMKSYDDAMDWTMLDRRFDDRTRETFGTGPVFLPVWWGRFDPAIGRGSVSTPSSIPSVGNQPPQGVSLPTIPGGDFAASMVGGIQSFSGNVVGDLTAFTGGVTQKTNPVPKPTPSSTRSGGGGGGRSCACACACAGCACACAGGGR